VKIYKSIRVAPGAKVHDGTREYDTPVADRRICGGKELWNGKQETLAELKKKYPDVWNHWVVIEERTPEYLSVWISMQKKKP